MLVVCGNILAVVGRTLTAAGCAAPQACLPIALKQEGYELMETHDRNSTIIIVDYMLKGPSGDIAASSVYTAGPHQQLFSVSLQNVNRQDPISDATDFSRVESMPGVYVANQMVARYKLLRCTSALLRLCCSVRGIIPSPTAPSSSIQLCDWHAAQQRRSMHRAFHSFAEYVASH